MTIAKGRIDTILSRRTEGYEGQEVPYELPVTAYPSNSGVILVNSPGSGELKDGRYNRWANLARELQSRGMLSMVTYNVPRPDAQFINPTEPYAYQNASWNRILVEGFGPRHRLRLGATSPVVWFRRPHHVPLRLLLRWLCRGGRRLPLLGDKAHSPQLHL